MEINGNTQLQTLVSKHNFIMPNLIVDTIGKIQVNQYGDEMVLSVDGVNWMVLNLKTYKEVYEFFSHISLSQGSVICSGMGLLLRESWLVNLGFDVTVVESTLDVINYHKKHNPEICSKMTIIHDDIHNIHGKYNTVLLDHYEHESQDEILLDVVSIMKNIECDVLWFWPLERFIESYHYRNSGGWEFYQFLRRKLPYLPNISKEVLFEFMEKFYLGQKTYQLPNKNM